MPSTPLLTRLSRLLPIVYLLVMLFLWLFVRMHAFNLDMTHDEAYSFKLIKTNYFIALFGSANTHWLNSACMEIPEMLFYESPGWLLPF